MATQLEEPQLHSYKPRSSCPRGPEPPECLASLYGCKEVITELWIAPLVKENTEKKNQPRLQLWLLNEELDPLTAQQSLLPCDSADPQFQD